MRWSAVFAGAILAIGLWILLQTLGMGLGLTAVDTDDAGSLRGVGIGTGIWSVLAPLIAIFLGALIAGRLAGTRESKVGALHGAVLWALTTAVGLYLMLAIVSAIASGVARVGTAAAGATGSIVSGAVSAVDGGGKGVMNALGIDTNDLLAPINQRLRERGKPPITADQLEATIQAVAQRGLREGELDRQVLVEEVARNTALSRADSEEVANQIEQQYQRTSQQVGETVSDIGEGAKHAGLVAADRTGKGLLAAGVMLLLGLGVSLLGGALGARSTAGPRTRAKPRGMTDVTDQPVVTTTPAGTTIVHDPDPRV